MMEESEKSCTTNKSENCLSPLCSEITVNQIHYAHPPHGGFMPRWNMDADYYSQNIPRRVGHVNREFSQSARAVQHREPEDRGATPAWMNPHHQPPAETSHDDTRGKSCHWEHGLNQCGRTAADRDTASGGDEYNSQLQSDEEDLEPPLPLRSDDEWQHYNPFVPPHHCINPCEVPYNFNPDIRHTPQPLCHHSAPHLFRRPMENPQNWLRCHSMSDSLAHGSVSVNVPQFFVPPVDHMSQVSLMNLSTEGAGASVSQPHEKRRNISLTDVCRNIFITYSSDVSSEIVPFVDFLAKQGFRPAIDIFDNSVRSMDINRWQDYYLNDPSSLIIICISPKYKADIEGSVADSHGLHTRYVHTMMQNEFIQQGSLNFRFIPVLFLNASQKDVPNWLQNTRVYRWPRDTEDLLLRLLRKERYVPPPVPMELTLVIRPVTQSSAATP